MVWLANLIIRIGATSSGQAFLAWILSKVWDVVSDEIKDRTAKDRVEKAVAKALEDYEQIIKDQNLMAADGLTEEEKNEIRRRKAKAQADIVNARP